MLVKVISLSFFFISCYAGYRQHLCPDLPHYLNDFIHQFVDQKYHLDFLHYYQRFVRQQEQRKQQRKLSYFNKIKQNAVCALEVKYPHLAAHIHMLQHSRSVSNDLVEQDAALFLMRFGIYQEFLKQKAYAKMSSLHKIKTFVADGTTLIAGWLAPIA